MEMITLRQLRYLSALAKHGGREIARRAEDVLTASRDLVDFARHRSGLLTGRLTLGVIPSLAPYLLPRILPMLQTMFPDLRLELRETQTRQLVDDIKSGALDAAMLALPLGEPDIDTIALFEDLFLLAVPASDPRKESARVAAQDIDQSRLILLEDGHCLRDQALAFCATAPRGRATAAGGTVFGASSLNTVIPPHLAAQGGFCRARRGGEGKCGCGWCINRLVIARSEATKQSIGLNRRIDCFVASLLAMARWRHPRALASQMPSVPALAAA